MSKVICPKCKSPMVVRKGKFGSFYGCTKYPTCNGIRKLNAVAAPVADRKPLKGSPEQQAIWDEIVNGNTHLVIKALAGTGKSTTCRESMYLADSGLRILYLAFNKDIVVDFSKGVPANCEIATINAKGHRMLCKAFPNLTLNQNKVEGIIAEVWQPQDADEIRNASLIYNAVDKLVGLSQGYLIDGTNSEELMELVCRHDVELDDEISELVLSLVPQVLQLDKARPSVISYNDQPWLPIVLNLPCDKYDLIFVDEAQDLTRCNQQFVLRLLAPNGRVVVVGDENQAIYGWRGSDIDSINNFTQQLFASNSVKELPLTVSRRCPKRIVEFARQWVPEFSAMPDAIEGTIESMNDKQAESLYRPGDMLLCRCNAPLTSIAFGLIKRGIKAVIRGRDIGKGLVSLINKLRADDVSDLFTKLEKWEAKEVAKYVGTKQEASKTQQIADRADCIRAIAEGCDNLSEVKANIEAIFANFEQGGQPKEAVILSSIHRAKGLESKRVFWIQPSLTCKTSQDWQVKEEIHLKYVAATRSKDYLGLVSLSRG